VAEPPPFITQLVLCPSFDPKERHLGDCRTGQDRARSHLKFLHYSSQGGRRRCPWGFSGPASPFFELPSLYLDSVMSNSNSTFDTGRKPGFGPGKNFSGFESAKIKFAGHFYPRLGIHHYLVSSQNLFAIFR
jgi:hypothetical protein